MKILNPSKQPPPSAKGLSYKEMKPLWHLLGWSLALTLAPVGATAWAQATASAKLCHPCKEHKDCGAGNLCEGRETGLGVCLQDCSAGGSCPTGFTCKSVAAGVRQCRPDGGCFIPCSDTRACPSGLTCTQGRCQRVSGGKQGDFCDDKAPCDSDHLCIDEGDTRNRCARRCGPPLGAAGTDCSNTTCNAGLSCIANGTRQACFKTCTDTCSGNETCTLISGKKACTCRSDADCQTGEICNKSVVGYGACVKAPTTSPCTNGLKCLVAQFYGYACLPEQGARRSGETCSLFLPCAQDLECLRLAPQSPPMCYKRCKDPNDSTTCQGLGICSFIGRTGNYCFCTKDQDCSNSDQCNLFGGGFQHGLCGAGEKSTCQTDAHCPPGYSCKQNSCTHDASGETTSSEPATPDASEPTAPDTREPATPDTSEPKTPDATPDTQATPETTADTAPQDAGNASETGAPQELAGSDLSTKVGSCQCSSAGSPTSALLATLLLLLMLTTRRTRPSR